MLGVSSGGSWDTEGRCAGADVRISLPALEAASWVELPGASGTLSFLQQKSVPRRKCAACKIVVHTPCIEQLEKVCVFA